MAAPSSALEGRLARLEAELAGTARIVETFGPVVRQVLEAELRIEQASRDLEDLAGERRECEGRLTARIDAVAEEARGARTEVARIREELTRAEQARADARTKIVLAVIAASATVLAALAGALATVLGS